MEQSPGLDKYTKQATELLAELTLKEKASLCSGGDFWHTKAVERLSIPRTMVTDGPHGLRKQAEESDHLGINDSVPATCFPTASTTACSFDPELLYEMGQALGEECLQEDVAVILGPGVNIKRSPLCGRNFEYFSEDPFLTGEMAAALVRGVQSRGVGTSVKHFAVNNQEARRLVIDAIVDERALREIYLSGFEAVVKGAQPWTVMCSYNKIGGVYASMNKHLLTDILRDEWGFDGYVMTDWGAIVDRVAGLESGLELEMPFTGPYNDGLIVKAVEDGTLDEQVLDRAVLRLLRVILAGADNARPGYKYDPEAHHALARRIAAESAVLMKNDRGLLPLPKGKKLALLGEFAEKPRYQGAGSSRINPNKLTCLRDVLAGRGEEFIYAPGYASGTDAPDEALLAQAEAAAKDADYAIVCIGLPDEYESEGFDRDHLRIPDSHIALLERAAAVNANTIVLLIGGSAMETAWLDKAGAMLLLYLGGEAGAEAAADLLFGDVCPSGKLAETFPVRLEDNPSYRYFPGGDKTVEHRESIYVGYRYYDKAGKAVSFPFGYGLSYTTFEYSGLKVKKTGSAVDVSLKVKNTGTVAGSETVQIYVSQKNPSVFKAERELKGFSKVRLEPGQEAAVTVTLPERAFAYYDVDAMSFTVEAGEYIVAAAASSRDIRLEETVTLEGASAKSAKFPDEYENLTDGEFIISDQAFAALYGKPLPPQMRQAGEPYTINSTLAEIAETKAGKRLMASMGPPPGAGGGDETMARMMERMMNDMPVRGIGMFSGGKLGPEQIAALVDEMNAE